MGEFICKRCCDEKRKPPAYTVHGDNRLSPLLIPCDVCLSPTRHDLLEQQEKNGTKICLACIADQHLCHVRTPENNMHFMR